MRDGANILFIFTDQQRFDTVHTLGNAAIRTPNLDRLVREGTAFDNAFTPSPVCVPARCAMHYGQYPAHTGCFANGDPMPLDGRESFVASLTRAGHRTHGIGKCHFTPEIGALRGFETRQRQEHPQQTNPERDEYLSLLADEGYGRCREWKYFDVPETGIEILFDRLNDPWETRNRSAAPETRGIVESFRKDLNVSPCIAR